MENYIFKIKDGKLHNGREQFLKALRDAAPHLDNDQLADYFNTNIIEFNNLLNNDDEVNQVLEYSRKEVIMKISQKIVDKAIAGHTESAKFYLENKAKWLKESEKQANKDNKFVIEFSSDVEGDE